MTDILRKNETCLMIENHARPDLVTATNTPPCVLSRVETASPIKGGVVAKIVSLPLCPTPDSILEMF